MNVEVKTGVSGGREAVVILTVAVADGDQRDPMTIATQVMNEACGRTVQPWENADTAGVTITNVAAVAVGSGPKEPLTDEGKLRLVETAWYGETKGEINIVQADDPTGYDGPLAAIVVAMWDNARFYVDNTATEQWGWNRGIVVDPVTDEEIARRIAVALNGLWFGGISG